jgi:hypothetical protein
MTAAGPAVATAVTPTTSGNYDWTEHVSNKGMYSIEIPASGGASINNDTEGVGWFTGVATGVLPWRGPTIGFRASGLNDLMIESAYSATRGLAGTALPAVASGSAGAVIISGTGTAALSVASGLVTVGTLSANVLTAAATAADFVAEIGGLPSAHSGTAQAGAATTVTLAAGASATNDLYTGSLVVLTGGTGAGQTRVITAYVGATKVATVATWATNPDNTSTYEVLPDYAISPIASLSTQAKADVNAEVVDVIRTDTVAELTAPPAANAALSAKINWLFMKARNKSTQTATTLIVMADDGSTTVGTSTVSDDATTATRGEFA